MSAQQQQAQEIAVEGSAVLWVNGVQITVGQDGAVDLHGASAITVDGQPISGLSIPAPANENYQPGDALRGQWDGWVYAGQKQDGSHLLVASQDAPGLHAWQNALDYAARQGEGVHLPDREEGKLLFNARHAGALANTFREDKRYWLSEQYDDSNAWGQWFDNGGQNGGHELIELPVRCVRSSLTI